MENAKDKAQQFEEILKGQPKVVMAKVDEHELKGKAIAALVLMDEEGDQTKVGMMLGGELSLPRVMMLLEALEDLRDKLTEHAATALFRGIFK